MFVVNNKQIELLKKQKAEIFAIEMCAHLKKTFPEKTAGINDSELITLIKKSVNKANYYGITGKGDIIVFLEFVAFHGDDFQNDPKFAWVEKILKQKKLIGSEKINQIEKRFVFQIK